MIYMTHPLHGAMNVGNDEAAAEHEKHGWKRDVWKQKEQVQALAEAPTQVSAQTADDDQDDVDELRCAYEEKHGEPADQRWGARRLRKEIG